MNSLFVKMMSITQHYNHEKYWKMRRVLTSGRTEGIIQYLYRIWVLYRIKKMDAFNGASLGTHLDKSAEFKTSPNLPHGIEEFLFRIMPLSELMSQYFIKSQLGREMVVHLLSATMYSLVRGLKYLEVSKSVTT